MKTPGHGRLTTWSTLAYGVALHAYPESFHRHFGESMTQVFRDQSRDAYRQSGAAGLARLWMNTLFDLVLSVIPAYMNQRRESMARLVLIASVLYVGVAVTAVGYSGVRYGEFYRAPAFSHDAFPDAHEDTLLTAYDTALGGEFGQYRAFAIGSAVTLSVMIGIATALFGLWQHSLVRGAGALAAGGAVTVVVLSLMPSMWFPLDRYPIAALWVMGGGPLVAGAIWVLVTVVGRYAVTSALAKA